MVAWDGYRADNLPGFPVDDFQCLIAHVHKQNLIGLSIIGEAIGGKVDINDILDDGLRRI